MSIRRQFATALAQVNLAQLADELRVELGALLHGVADYLAENEIAVDTESALSPAQIGVVQTIIDAHVAVDYGARQDLAETTVASIPNWATWTEAEALVWFDANVVDLASARTVLRATVRIVLAMRNKLWPNLEGS